MFMRQNWNEALTVPYVPFFHSDYSLNGSASRAHYKLEINNVLIFIMIIIDIIAPLT